MNPVTLIVVALAASRITRLITADTITERLRVWVWRRWPASDTVFGDSEVDADGSDTLGHRLGKTGQGVEVFRTNEGWHPIYSSFIGNVISCSWCTGIWVAIVVWGIAWVYPVTVPYLAALAIAEVIGLLNDR